MSLLLRCPVCGSITNAHIEYNNGFSRNIYNCLNCNWTNRYTQITTTPVNNYPSGIYTFQTNTTIVNGGLQNAR